MHQGPSSRPFLDDQSNDWTAPFRWNEVTESLYRFAVYFEHTFSLADYRGTSRCTLLA